MKNHRINVQRALALCFGFFIFLGSNACKERTLGDTDLVPGVDNINTFELTQYDLNAQLLVNLLDTFVTGNAEVPAGAIGTLKNDPFYGDISSSIYLQFTIPTNNFAAKDSVTSYDSLVLVLPYTSITYGDTIGKLALEVFEIDDPGFRVDTANTTFYAHSSFNVKPSPLGIYDGEPASWANDTMVYPGFDSVRNQLRIKLSAEALAKFATISQSELRNNASFINFFNGVWIKSVEGMSPEYYKALYYFLLSGNKSSVTDDARLELHFSVGTGNTKGILQFPFHKKYSAFSSYIERNYSGRPAAAYADNGVATDSFLVTGAPGFQTDIVIDNLDQIPANAMIYLARLELNVYKDPLSYIYSFPSLLMLNVVDEDNKISPIADYRVTPSPDVSMQAIQVEEAKKFVGGAPIEKLIGGEEYETYTLNFPREIQRAVLDGKKKLTLRLFPYYQLPGAYRLIAPGLYNGGDAKAKINIIYTKP